MIINNLNKNNREIAALLFVIFFQGLYTELRSELQHPWFPTTVKENDHSSLFTKKNQKINPSFAKSFPNEPSRKESEEPIEQMIGGPGQPEMQSFQSVNANNLVDLFTGDFSYNIPLMDVGGYPINIHYNSGISMDQDASWVGLGWNVNPGTISRNMRGIPDDFNGTDTIEKKQNIKKNTTVGITADFNPEIIGLPLKVGVNVGLYHNNYTGPNLELGLNASISAGKLVKGEKTSGMDSMNFEAGLGLKLSSGQGVSVNPTLAATFVNKESGIKKAGGSFGFGYNSRTGLQDLTVAGFKRVNLKDISNQKSDNHKNLAVPASTISFSRTAYTPTISLPYTSLQFSFKVKAGGEIFGFHPLVGLGGYVSQQYISENDRVAKLPAYGYLHYQDANNKENILLDFNRESDIPFTSKVPHIGIPVYTYDTYSITGEGNGGMFRPYRGDIGYIRDHSMKTKNSSGNFSLDLGAGNAAHGGADISFTYAQTENKMWDTENPLRKNIAFRSADTTFEAVYFRNPGEKTSNTETFYQSIGDTDLVRVNLSSSNNFPLATTSFTRFNKHKTEVGTFNISSQTIKKSRDKRKQVISHLTAEEASSVGLDTMINIYPENVFSALCDCAPSYTCASYTGVVKEARITAHRKPHHLSEIKVLNPDGRTYIYGIPAYNLKQKEVTFSALKSRSNNSTGLVKYTSGVDNSTSNTVGKDHYFSSEEVPAYAHSFLLTAVTSPDYIDVTGDGISIDDRGDAIKFNYSRTAGINNPHKWRTPFSADSASYAGGFKTDHSDDKGHYVYGEKEIWYLHSIESKTMIATFVLESREDGYGVTGENGGKNNSSGLRRLKEINLYSKADLLHKGSSAKPIKTVHFAYSYTLCKQIENGTNNGGKLTLDSIWFSYNKNQKGRKNPYIFKYNQSRNFNYSKKGYDRWGNYKNKVDNPAGLSNDDYPYALKDSLKMANNAAAWTLDTIVLPAGGKMIVDYESDDYAYVQNRRAMEMFQLLGFSSSTDTSSMQSRLYLLQLLTSLDPDNYYVFVDLPQPVYSKTEFFQKYLEGNSKLFFRINVLVPSDVYGAGYESFPCYVEYESFGIAAVGSRKAWIKLKSVKGQSPLTFAALQFLRLNLPSKAYPGSDLGSNNSLRSYVEMLLGMGKGISQALIGFNADARFRGWMQQVGVSSSFVRLNSPQYKKLGGGLRVKRIKIYDNWHKMTAQAQKESVYGQEYRYTTVKEINGKHITISSGVASYEPAIGSDENPFQLPLEYTEQTSVLAPTFNRYIDNPVGETFFPAPSVGYSKVRVSSINRKNIRSASGFEETEFFTTYDFPTFSDFTPFDRKSKKEYKSPLRHFFKMDIRHYLTLSQGFRVELNDMNGKMKAHSTYSEVDSLNPIVYTQNYYLVSNPLTEKKQLINTVPVIDNTGLVREDGQVGKDIELMIDFREQRSQSLGANVQANNDFFIIPTPIPIPINIPAFIPVPQHSLSRFRSVTVLKVINRYGILDSVVNFDKGSKVSVKNMVYDPETGDPVLTRTQNEFNDPVYSFSYPAAWAYDGVGSAYKNISGVFKNVTIENGRLTNNYYEKFFVNADEVLVRAREGVNQCAGAGLVYNTHFSTKKLWVLDGKHVGRPGELYFIDRHGKMYSGTSADIKIVRSGRRNINGTVGALSCLKNPIKTTNGTTKIQFDTDTDVITSTGAEWNDVWKEHYGRFDVSYTWHSLDTPFLSANPFIHGILGNWQLAKTYVYYARRKESSPAAGTNIRRDGAYNIFSPLWGFSSALLVKNNADENWVWNKQVTLHNVKGYEIENVDPLGRYNSGLYNYQNNLPVAIAQNAQYREIAFEGFETYEDYNEFCATEFYRTHFTPGYAVGGDLGTAYLRIVSSQKHTGKSSLKVSANEQTSDAYVTFRVRVDSVNQWSLTTVDRTVNNICSKEVFPDGNFMVNAYNPTKGKKMVISAWLKEDRDCNCTTYSPKLGYVQTDTGKVYLQPKGSIINGWQLHEAVFDVGSIVHPDVVFDSHDYDLYVDDIRVQPVNSAMKSFVYHPTTLRLMAELDENNYATLYEYDDDGTLVRVKKETSRGIKTITETRSALSK